MINGLDLFSGIGGISLALANWVRPVAYCENDRYAQAVILSRQCSGGLPVAPIWDDVTTLSGEEFRGVVDIIYGGFPCQDISLAGNGGGLGGKRSGLFFEIARLVSEIRPQFVFLENVPAIRTRGASTVGGRLASLGYDCRWITLSAADIGAPHIRQRWFLLAHAKSERGRKGLPDISQKNEKPPRSKMLEQNKCWKLGDASESPSFVAHAGIGRHGNEEKEIRSGGHTFKLCGGDVADTESGRELQQGKPEQQSRGWPGDSGEEIPDTMRPGLQTDIGVRQEQKHPTEASGGWWSTEPNVGRVANGVPARVDRIKGLGNAVVPAQAREAFKRLIGDFDEN